MCSTIVCLEVSTPASQKFLFSLNVLFDSELTNNIIVADSSMNSWEAAWPSGLGKSGGPWFKSSALLLSGFVTW